MGPGLNPETAQMEEDHCEIYWPSILHKTCHNARKNKANPAVRPKETERRWRSISWSTVSNAAVTSSKSRSMIWDLAMAQYIIITKQLSH